MSLCMFSGSPSQSPVLFSRTSVLGLPSRAASCRRGQVVHSLHSGSIMSENAVLEEWAVLLPSHLHRAKSSSNRDALVLSHTSPYSFKLPPQSFLIPGHPPWIRELTPLSSFAKPYATPFGCPAQATLPRQQTEQSYVTAWFPSCGLGSVWDWLWVCCYQDYHVPQHRTPFPQAASSSGPWLDWASGIWLVLPWERNSAWE